MTDYTKTVNFAAKDTLPSGDSGKIIRGTEFETEFDNISTAIATKADLESPTFTGTATIPTAVITTFTLGTTPVTADASELNILDGVTADATELNILDGATVTTDELNLLDGVTATTAELNYVDGVTSNIQTQLDSKLDASNPSITGNLSFGDSEKAQFGDGNDLQIYHNGSNSFIEDAGTGNLNIKSNGNGVVIKDGSDNNLIAGLHATGEAKLWHVSGGTATERLITTSTGVRVDGEFTLNNNGTNIYATSSAFASASPFVDVKSDEASDTASTTVAVIRGPGTTSAAVARTAGIALKISNETSTTESKKGYDIYTTSSSTFGNNPSFHIDYADGTKRFSAAESGESYLYYNDSEKLATGTGGVSVTGVTDTDQLRVTTPTVPSSASDTGTAGDIAWDADYIYVCTATNTWKRVAISTWS